MTASPPSHPLRSELLGGRQPSETSPAISVRFVFVERIRSC